MRHSVIYFFFIVSALHSHANDEQRTKILKEGAETIRLIWKEWMGKPDLKYKAITQDSLKIFFGKWNGEYEEYEAEKGDDKISLTLNLNSDGTWTSKEFRPDMKNGHWYLSEGMILLFEGKVNEDGDLSTALTLKDGHLNLLNADSKNGIVKLKKQNKAKQTNP